MGQFSPSRGLHQFHALHKLAWAYMHGCVCVLKLWAQACPSCAAKQRHTAPSFRKHGARCRSGNATTGDVLQCPTLVLPKARILMCSVSVRLEWCETTPLPGFRRATLSHVRKKGAEAGLMKDRHAKADALPRPEQTRRRRATGDRIMPWRPGTCPSDRSQLRADHVLLHVALTLSF